MTFSTITNGSRSVITSTNDGTRYDSRLYVDNGQVATLTAASHKTKAGAERWAKKVLAR